MHDQAQEHANHASKFQNCFEEAGIRAAMLNARGQAEVDTLVAAGRFVIAERSLYHCRVTDAVVGSVLTVRGHFASRVEADSNLAVIHESGGADWDAEPFILPAEPREPARTVRSR